MVGWVGGGQARQEVVGILTLEKDLLWVRVGGTEQHHSSHLASLALKNTCHGPVTTSCRSLKLVALALVVVFSLSLLPVIIKRLVGSPSLV
ncbi:hypothetical protein E2C01_023388 [Portunus trituberculatus]|uniref:Uncharacterized protein n=1 Tax=Portunus trituberculatus TaxID=210409 RepID=A0A5B7E8P1_PORTR|nr:hypothetical protein [Portunus trituberculatus]